MDFSFPKGFKVPGGKWSKAGAFVAAATFVVSMAPEFPYLVPFVVSALTAKSGKKK